jgi:integrase
VTKLGRRVGTHRLAVPSGARRRERRLDTQRVFLYKDRPIRDVKTAFDKGCRRAEIANLRLHDLHHTAGTTLRRAGGDAPTAMKTASHKSGRMHRRYNTIELEDLRGLYHNWRRTRLTLVITLEPDASRLQNVNGCLPSMRP